MTQPLNWKKFLTTASLSLSTAFFISTSFAQTTPIAATPITAAATPASPMTLVPPAPNLSAKGYVLMDAKTGKIIAQKNMNQQMPPASLTKMMTLYLTFQALKNGQAHLDDPVRITKKAWHMGGSRMFLRVGTQVPLRLLIQGVIVASGNDACVALAEYIAGTEPTFAQLMNQTAARLGMKHSHFMDSTGLPNPNHYSTPHDMSLLARALVNDFPAYYHFFSQKWLTYNNIKQPNRNRLLWRDSAVDGLKTGHTKAAGYCLVSSGKHQNTRLISVVMGTPTDSARANDSQALLNYGFRFFKTYKLFNANQVVSQQRVWLGKEKHGQFGVAKTLFVTIPVNDYKQLKASMSISKKLKAPIVKGQSYGTLQVTLNGKPISSANIIALQDDPKGGLWTRLTDGLHLFFKK